MADLIIARNGGGANKIDISSAVVTLTSGTLTYDGTLKTQGIQSVVVNGTTLVANTDYTVMNNAYTNTGNYTLTITGIGGYKGTKNVAWSIGKAQGSLSVNSDSLVMASTAGTTGTVTITKTGDGTISASSGSSSVATASVSGTTVTVTAVSTGVATITVTMADGANYLGASDAFEVTTVSSTLAENSPETIQKIVIAGTGSNYWSVGARTAAISIGAFSGIAATTNVSAFIIGFNHNSSKEGNGIHFQFGKIGNTDIAFFSLVMRSDGYNAGGWHGSDMKITHCPAFFNALPQAWQKAIATCTKYTDNTGGGSNTASYVTATTDDKIWLLAEYEVFGTRSYANSAEQNYQLQYDYYKNGNSKVKYRHNSTDTTCFWWWRSPSSTTSDRFCCVSTSGDANHRNSANSSIGFAPGFIIGAPVAKIGNTKYGALSTAISSASANDTIVLLTDVEPGSTLTVDKTITLDLNGNTVTMGANSIVVSGTENKPIELTITDGNGNGEITGSGTQVFTVANQYSTLTINGGENTQIACTGYRGVTITGGKLNVKNGTIESKYSTVVLTSAVSELKVEGGYITSTDDTAIAVTNTSAKVYVSDGHVKSATAKTTDIEGTSYTFKGVTGGYFSKSATSNYVASGYSLVSNPDTSTNSTYPYMVVANS